MKQKITYLQAQELTSEQRIKLVAWWKPQEGDYLCINDHEEMIYYLNGIDKAKSVPLLTIGQMLHILREHDQMKTIECNPEHDVWTVNGRYRDAELCDALWQAVLAVL